MFRYTCCNICNFLGIMFSILLIFAYLMADVALWGHGGEGAGDPSPPGGFLEARMRRMFPRRRLGGKPKMKNYGVW
ncbi:hypothetical protein HanXRQr2_Chr11g0475661 [Helianthus annuus]|uniref:Uncharacterized protein n=1 Tax=Helianthus annuus TaxID=4232 RepID=A0A9K3HM34_HELAN|nr:hypothetical protein HanXRQr2_Chr11g0475661 [Helianthus annuus]KAJ0508011.1 hypothetical protein HanIR_Chr11g0512601 [Helianthus annuus]KAJ0516353.1 hypothetical protein HanHA89_Chr11g0412941 [Helianthus annuus]